MELNELRYIVVEGAIGVGNTSLARKLGLKLGRDLLLEAPAENPFLERFYAEPERFALATQLNFNERHQHKVALVHARVRQRQIRRVDNSIAEEEQINIERSGAISRSVANASMGGLNPRSCKPQLVSR